MKVWINRDKCDSNLSACLSCFGQFVRTGVPDRGCITDFEENGSEDVMVYMFSDGQEREPIFIPKEEREIVAYEGWDKYVTWEPRFRKNEGTDRRSHKNE
ncbi:MAG: hypothetical protein MN733_40055 [Nitrososphaera sp.]|nr:hypothetical protein [Nitrososphaera sp.]